MTRRLVLIAAIAITATVFATTAWAGPKEEMQTVANKFLALRSYHVTMENSDKRVPKMETDFQAPDRYRMRMPMGTQYVIGDTMYMTIDGRTMRVPMPKGTMTQWRQSEAVFRNIAQSNVESLGNEMVDGKTAKKYRMTQSGKTPTSSLLWIGGNGLPIRVETTGTSGKRASTVTIRYSRFNDPSIKISPP